MKIKLAKSRIGSYFTIMSTYFSFKNYQLRLVQESDIPSLRRLVNEAYKELSDLGLNYTGAYQDEEVTRERISQGQAFVIDTGGLQATVLLRRKNYFTNKNTSYISQLAVSPHLKKQGLGSLMMDFCEQLSLKQNFEAVQLDTAKPAQHLVNWYLKRGYRIVGETCWDGKNYESWIFEKPLIKN